MPLKVIANKLLKVGTAIASNDACCCGDGDCDFGCTGTEPELTGLNLDITAFTGSGCACTGDGTYLLPSVSTNGVAIPGLTGTADNCYFCKFDIDLGSCNQLISSHVICETESFPSALPPTLMAACDAYPNSFSGSVDGTNSAARLPFERRAFGQPICAAILPLRTR